MGNNIKPPVIDKLPKMKIRQMRKVWENATKILSEEKKRDEHEPAIMVLEAIDQEWQKRRTRPRDKDDDYFDWPSTDAPTGPGKIRTDGWQPDGMLKYMGYHVGQTNGKSTSARHAILSQVFQRALPPVFPDEYLDEWGDPETAGRLRKMAETIAALVRNAKRRSNASMIGAIRDWEDDLDFLHEKYYIGKFNFAWPGTEKE